MMRKLLSFIFVVLILSSFSVSVFAEAEKAQIYGTETSVKLPEGVIAIDASLNENDETWEKAGITDIVNIKTICNELNVSTIFTDGNYIVYASRKDSQSSAMYYNLNDIDEKTLEKLAGMYSSDKSIITAESNIYKTDVIPFIYDSIMLDLADLDENGNTTKKYELVCFTIVNGYSLTFRILSPEPFTVEEENFIKSIVDGFEIIELKTNSAEIMHPVKAWIIILFVLGIILWYIFGSKYTKKKEKERSHALAEKLALFRQETKFLENPLFVNVTEHSGKAIKDFSIYQTFRLNPLEPTISIGVTLIGTLISWLMHAKMIITIVLAVLLLYSLYKLLTGPKNIERSLTRQFSYAKTREAKFEFYEDEFTISGVQAKQVFPYFLVTKAVKYKDMVYIYFGDGVTYFVSENGFEKGDIDSFSEFITKKIKEQK